MEAARRSDAVVYGVELRTASVATLGYLVDFRSGLQPDIPPVVPPVLLQRFLPALAEETGGKLEAERSDRLRDVFVGSSPSFAAATCSPTHRQALRRAAGIRFR